MNETDDLEIEHLKSLGAELAGRLRGRLAEDPEALALIDRFQALYLHAASKVGAPLRIERVIIGGSTGS